MRAVYIEEYGSNDVVRVGELPAPAYGPLDVLVDVHAASVNPLDWKIREGKAKLLLPYKFPLVLGNDFSGVIREVGAGVKDWQPGDEVIGRPSKVRIGTFAEQFALRAGEIAPKPAALSHEEAASLPLVGLTSVQALSGLGGLRPGHRVLIHAGSGGVGAFAIQFAKAKDAWVATTCSDRHIDLVRSLGADQVVDYRKERFEEVVRDCDIVFDTQGGEVLKRSFQSLAPGGVIVTINGIPDAGEFREYGKPLLAPVGAVANWQNHRRARARGGSFHYLLMEANGGQLRQIVDLVNEGRIRPVVDRVYPLEETKEALAYSQSGHASGKIVIKVR